MYFKQISIRYGRFNSKNMCRIWPFFATGIKYSNPNRYLDKVVIEFLQKRVLEVLNFAVRDYVKCFQFTVDVSDLTGKVESGLPLHVHF